MTNLKYLFHLNVLYINSELGKCDFFHTESNLPLTSRVMLSRTQTNYMVGIYNQLFGVWVVLVLLVWTCSVAAQQCVNHDQTWVKPIINNLSIILRRYKQKFVYKFLVSNSYWLIVNYAVLHLSRKDRGDIFNFDILFILFYFNIDFDDKTNYINVFMLNILRYYSQYVH